MGYVVSIVNMKGGVGKTTVTVNLGTCLARDRGKRVLIVDLDTQVNATLSMMPPLYFAKLKQERRTLKTLVEQTIRASTQPRLPVQDVVYRDICQVKGLDILAGDVELYDDFLLSALIETKSQQHRQSFEQTWNSVENNLLRVILKPVLNRYDLILLDFPPSDTLVTRSALLASHFYLVPARAEPLSVVGIGLLESRLRQFRESDRAKLEMLGIVFTARGQATSMATKVKHRLAQEFGAEQIFKTEIPTNVEVARAVDDFQPVVLNNPSASGAKAYANLAPEFLQKLGQRLRRRQPPATAH
ncbi:MAG: ParA family protein [Spirulinaceae cyanobacterium RM2_2_10]|nr:ParA family protein [Spirulinaceae cyanobacterium SM2_1_0]NJO19570.1 ParA family protein [Spirulinaceae cyanobacterium RM2_2_10]